MSYIEKHMTGGLNGVQWHHSIQFKIVLLVLLSSMLVIAASGYLAYNYIYENKNKDLQELANVTAERLSHHLVAPMWAVDYSKVDALIEAEMRENSIVGLVVMDENGESIFSAKERGVGGDIVASKGNLSDQSFAIATQDVLKNGESIGNIKVFLNREKLTAEVSSFATWLAILAAALALVITITVGMALRIFVVKPIQALTAGADHIAKGDLTKRIDYNRKDEIGYLGLTINRMQYSLRVAIHRIRNSDAQQRRSEFQKAS